MFKFTIIVLIYHCLSLNTELPLLQKVILNSTSKLIFNIKVGQSFSIPLPLFDSPYQKQYFNVESLSQQQFQLFQQNKITQLHGKPTTIDSLPFQCSLAYGSAWIYKQIASIKQDYINTLMGRWVQNQYIHISSKSLLYILNVASFQISAYSFNQKNIQKLASYRLPTSQTQSNYSQPTMATSSFQDSIYIFTSGGTYQIFTNTILTNIKQRLYISGFNSAAFGGVDKVLHGWNKMLIALKRADQVIIIPEDDQKLKFTSIKTFKGIDISPQDIILQNGIIYILDFVKGVFMFNLQSNGKVQERDFIQFSQGRGNFMFKIFQNTLFINFNDIDASKIVQINLNHQERTYHLVRYFKASQYITNIDIFTVWTSYYGQPTSTQYSPQFINTFLFITTNFDDMDIYPFNLDPRIIKKVSNSVSVKRAGIKHIFHIVQDKFIIVTGEQIKYIRLKIQRPSILCSVSHQAKLTLNPFRIKVKTNLSSCEHEDHSLKIKQSFNQYCQLQTEYYLKITDPQQSLQQRYFLYGIVIGIIALFVIGLVCLMQWRSNKMMILKRLTNEIANFRKRHKKIQPFVEENMQNKDIQIDLPQFHQ